MNRDKLLLFLLLFTSLFVTKADCDKYSKRFLGFLRLDQCYSELENLTCKSLLPRNVKVTFLDFVLLYSKTVVVLFILKESIFLKTCNCLMRFCNRSS